MASAFNFVIFGGLDKPYYTRFRELRNKYGLKDKGLVECLIWLALQNRDNEAITELDWFVPIYKKTAPEDMTPLAEVAP